MPVIVNVLGWGVAFGFALRAQRRNLRNQILDRARGEIVDAVRDAQLWIASVDKPLLTIQIADDVDRRTAPGWYEEVILAADKPLSEADASGNQLRWSQQLEEYQILFPSLTAARAEIVNLHLDIHRRVNRLFVDGVIMVRNKFPINHAAVSQQVTELRELLLDEAALFEDVRVIVQNEALGEITRKRIPRRVPQDPEVPRLLIDEQGQYHIRRIVDRGQ